MAPLYIISTKVALSPQTYNKPSNFIESLSSTWRTVQEGSVFHSLGDKSMSQIEFRSLSGVYVYDGNLNVWFFIACTWKCFNIERSTASMVGRT